VCVCVFVFDAIKIDFNLFRYLKGSAIILLNKKNLRMVIINGNYFQNWHFTWSLFHTSSSVKIFELKNWPTSRRVMFGRRASKIGWTCFSSHYVKRWFLDTKRTWFSPFFTRNIDFSTRSVLRTTNLLMLCHRVRQVPRIIFCPSRMSIRNIFLGHKPRSAIDFWRIRRIRQNGKIRIILNLKILYF